MRASTVLASSMCLAALTFVSLPVQISCDAITNRTKEDPPLTGPHSHSCPIDVLAHWNTYHQCAAPANWFPAPDPRIKDNHWPWTRRPWCINERSAPKRKFTLHRTYCIYVKEDFADGQGIVIWTTPAIAWAIAHDSPALHDTNDTASLNSIATGKDGLPPYSIQDMPEKGFGVVANRRIHQGERIIQEPVLWAAHGKIITEVADEDRIPMTWHSVYSLPPESVDLMLAMYTTHGGDQINDIVRTNSYRIDFNTSDDSHCGIFPLTCRANHDCRPP